MRRTTSTDTPESSYEECKAPIERWHKKGRLLYPSPRVLRRPPARNNWRCQRLREEEYPDTWVHTHLMMKTKQKLGG